MPFNKSDVENHIKGLNDQQKEAWVSIANSVLEECDGDESECEGRAIRIANDRAKKVGESKMNLYESFQRGQCFEEAKIDRSSGIISNVTLLGKLSANGRIYSDQSMQDAARLYEGVQFYIDHPTDRELKERNGVRSVRDLAGKVRNTRVAGDRVRGDLQILSTYSDLVFSLAEQMPDSVGNSHRAQGTVKRENGTEIVESLEKVFAVELVSDPATTQGLFEAHHKETEMDLKELNLSKLKSERPDLIEVIQRESEEGSEMEKLKEENAALKKENEELKLKEQEREREKLVAEKLKEAELPDRFVTDLLKEQLQDAKDEDEIDRLIEERKELAKATRSGPKSVEREPFTEGNHREPTADDIIEASNRLFT